MFRKLEEFAKDLESLMYVGNPVPIWIWIIIGGLMAGFGGLAIWQFYQASQPVVQSIQNLAPLIGSAVSLLLFFLSLMPFFFLSWMVMQILTGLTG